MNHVSCLEFQVELESKSLKLKPIERPSLENLLVLICLMDFLLRWTQVVDENIAAAGTWVEILLLRSRSLWSLETLIMIVVTSGPGTHVSTDWGRSRVSGVQTLIRDWLLLYQPTSASNWWATSWRIWRQVHNYIRMMFNLQQNREYVLKIFVNYLPQERILRINLEFYCPIEWVWLIYQSGWEQFHKIWTFL